MKLPKRLNHTMILHEQKLETDKPDFLQLAEDFISRNDRRQNNFGMFVAT